MIYNKDKAKSYILTAERSIEIVRRILAGETDQDILIALANKKIPTNRQLIDYYRKSLTIKV